MIGPVNTVTELCLIPTVDSMRDADKESMHA